MNEPAVEVAVREIVAVSGGYAIFLGNEEKVFIILVDPEVGAAIMMSIGGTHKERPLTHDLLASILQALGAKGRKGYHQRSQERHLFCKPRAERPERITAEDRRN